MAGTEEKPVGMVRYGYEGNELLKYMMDVFEVEGVSANSVDFSHCCAQKRFPYNPVKRRSHPSWAADYPFARLYHANSGGRDGGFGTLGGVFSTLLAS